MMVMECQTDVSLLVATQFYVFSGRRKPYGRALENCMETFLSLYFLIGCYLKICMFVCMHALMHVLQNAQDIECKYVRDNV